MLPPLASLDDFQTRYPDNDDDERATAALEDASSEVRAFTGLTWVDEDGALTDVPDIVQVITMRAASRVYANPDNYRSEQIGQYSYQYSSTSDGSLLTAAERRQLVRAVGQGVHSLRLVRDGLPGESTMYVASSEGGDLIPWEAV